MADNKINHIGIKCNDSSKYKYEGISESIHDILIELMPVILQQLITN